jgi:phosphoglycerol transferase MdoB-like AlkP superfamily enzyme
MKDYTIEEQNSAKWGVRDDITFNTLAARIKNNTNLAPTHPRTHAPSYLIGFSTLSSHEPWDVPTHRLSDPILNSFNYLDECIGRFIEDMKKSPEWDNLLVILLPDHGYSHCGVNFEHEDHDHVPMLWLGGAIKEPRRIEKICNQSDLAATLLGQMKLPHDEFYFSRDVMSSSYTYPFAVHNYNNGMSMVDSTGFMVYDLNSNSLIVNKSSDANRMVRIGKAILQTEAKELRKLGNREI